MIKAGQSPTNHLGTLFISCDNYNHYKNCFIQRVEHNFIFKRTFIIRSTFITLTGIKNPRTVLVLNIKITAKIAYQ